MRRLPGLGPNSFPSVRRLGVELACDKPCTSEAMATISSQRRLYRARSAVVFPRLRMNKLLRSSTKTTFDENLRCCSAAFILRRESEIERVCSTFVDHALKTLSLRAILQ